MDMLNVDLCLKNEAKAKKSSKKRKAEELDPESGFHFIAFMPIEGDLWKLDGLERQPTRLGMSPETQAGSYLTHDSLGPIQGDWIDQARPDIMARMVQAEENQIEFAILGLVKDPLYTFRSSLAANVKSINALSERMHEIRSKGKALSHNQPQTQGSYANSHVLEGPDLSLGLTQQQIEESALPEPISTLLSSSSSSDSLPDLMIQRTELIAAQTSLKLAIQEEQQSANQEEDRANARRGDMGGKMQTFAQKVKQKAQQ